MNRAARVARVAPPSSDVADAADDASRWDALFGGPAPQRLASLVAQAVAWREQMLLHGDVAPAIAHDLQLAAEHAATRRGLGQAGRAEEGAGSANPQPTTSSAAVADPALATPVSAAPAIRAARKVAPGPAALPPAASQLLPGSQLIKAYGGRNHVVAVEDNGFRYEDQLFTSLSAIAKHITGTHWNGLLFFGLRKRRSYPPKPRRHD
ncbi:DUF2924 domain-containing protein [Sphingomonas sp. CLY1604]|uniref:DUF2924 domain-containing protein n=1 Tax=Sphingomonas sp. CLY1604 TaxID=3457786 RepID=UPI003FD841F1